MEITPEMLDVIEELKGRRKEGLWDYRCQQYYENKKNPPACPPKKTDKNTVNKESNS